MRIKKYTSGLVSAKYPASETCLPTPEGSWHSMAVAGGPVIKRTGMQLTGMNTVDALNLGWLEELHPDDPCLTMKTFRDAMTPLRGERRLGGYSDGSTGATLHRPSCR